MAKTGDDILREWVADRCIEGFDARVKTSAAYADYQAWCVERYGRRSRRFAAYFTQRVKALGYGVNKSGVNWFEGIELVKQAEPIAEPIAEPEKEIDF